MNQLLSSASKAFMIWPLALSHLLSPSLGLPTSSHLAFFYFLNTSNSFPLQGLCTYFSLCLELTPGFSYDSLLFTSQISSKISPPQEALPDNPHSKFPFPLCHFLWLASAHGADASKGTCFPSDYRQELISGSFPPPFPPSYTLSYSSF